MTWKNKFLRSIIIGATAIALSTQLTTPTRAAESSDVLLGLFGGLVIAGAIYNNKHRRDNRGYVTSNRQHYRRHDPYRYANDYNRYGHDWRGRNQFDHGRHNRHNRRNRY